MTATISKGTLNLRFMQNAQRSDQELEIESAETVATKDESHWEVAKEVRNMWGLTSSEPSSSSLVTHEASYLPFVLSRADASGSPPQPVKLRGRRKWNKRGQEVTEETEPPLDDSSARPDPTTTTAAAEQQEQRHHQLASRRLTSISSFGPGSSTKETKRAKSRSTKSARELIREAPSGIRDIKIKITTEEEEEGDTPGPTTVAPRSAAPLPSGTTMKTIANDKIDCGASPLTAPPAPAPAPLPKFLKPAGVDDPSDDVARRDGSRPTQREDEPGADTSTRGNDNNYGTRRRQNLKRERDDRHEIAAASTADRKKCKKSGAAAAS